MTHSHPLIGLPAWPQASRSQVGPAMNVISSAYINALIEAGGLPVLIPWQTPDGLLPKILARLDGLLFSGGGDLDPAWYNEVPQVDNLAEVQPERDRLELALMQLALQRGTPFLAICRGIQVMNVAGGGNLWQDIAAQNPQAIRHDYYYRDRHPRDYLAHEVRLEESSRLSQILKTDRLPVNSMHHQGLKTIAPGLKATGYTADGLVEVLEAPGHPFGLGVQWHPEDLVDQQESARQLFGAFIKAAKNGR